MTIERPAQYGDVHCYPNFMPKRWAVTIQRDGVPVDLTASSTTATLQDNGVQVATLPVDKTEAATGTLILTLDQTTLDLVGRYSTFRLHESTFTDLFVQGRIVKEV